jgi:outer membrane protein OmpA-like peptidoglycan-associated protein
MKYLNRRINIEKLSRICRKCNAWLLPFRPLRCIVLFYLVFLYNVIPSQAGIPTTTTSPATAIPTAPLPKTPIALSVLFENKSDTILPKYYADLDKLGEALERLPSIVEIQGYTDSSGSQQANQTLSEKRANNVKNYLTKRFCIDPRRLIVKGYGSSRPSATNTTLEGRRSNNRIEVALPGNDESSVTKISIEEMYVFFQSNSETILQPYQTDLDSLGKELTSSPYCAYRVQIEGHTDDTERENWSLSEKRAERVKRYLIDHFSIVPERLMVKGYGDSVPRFSNATPRCGDNNRRVEIVGTHLRRDTVIPQWFQASKATADSDGHAVHC